MQKQNLFVLIDKLSINVTYYIFLNDRDDKVLTC